MLDPKIQRCGYGIVGVHPWNPPNNTDPSLQYLLEIPCKCLPVMWHPLCVENSPQMVRCPLLFVIPLITSRFPMIGKRIVTADADGTLIFWDPRSPTPLWKLTSEDGRFDLDGITSLAVNPASTVAVVGGASGSIRVVNLNKGDVVGALATHKEGESVEAIAFVGFAGTAEVVVTGSTDGTARVWDLNTLKVRNTLEHGVGYGLPQ